MSKSKSKKPAAKKPTGETVRKQPTGKTVRKKPKLVEKTMEVTIADMKFPTDNPRIFHRADSLTQKQVQDLLFDEEDVRTLKKQILMDGLDVYEEPYLRKIGAKHWVVEEGSRRICALKSIIDDIISGKLLGVKASELRTIRCKIIRSTATKAEIMKFLASEHIAKKKDWPAANKGEVIFQLIDVHGETPRSVADDLGIKGGARAVERLYKAYRLTETYCQRKGGKYIHTFSYFDEYLKKPILLKQAQSDPGFEDYLMDLIHEGKLSEHKDIRKLADLFDPNEDATCRKLALQELNKPNGKFKKAYQMFVDSSPKGSVEVFEKAAKLVDAITIGQYKNLLDRALLKPAIDKLAKSLNNARKLMNSATATAGASAI